MSWNANDYANIITISAAAISSVLLVIFKSRCTNIDYSCCYGLFKYNCVRDVMSDDETEGEKDKKKAKEEKRIIKTISDIKKQNIEMKLTPDKP
mgnify:CR=1 FL=1